MVAIYKRLIRKIKFIWKRLFKEIKIQEWSIGIYSGANPLNMDPLGKFPIITKEDLNDINADYVADPFIIKHEDMFYVFYEIKEKNKFDTYIAYSKSNNLRDWEYCGIIMKGEPIQSYPCVFKDGEDIFMVPESYRDNSVRLYKAINFPDRWEFRKRLISGKDYVDPTIFKHNKIWWMFVSTTDNDKLLLFYSYKLEGEWIEHPLSPLIEGDKTNSRPSGNIFRYDNMLYRTAQDCSNNYGEKVNVYHIIKLDKENYVEEKLEHPVLKKGLSNWSKDGMHTFSPLILDDGTWVAIVDGYNFVIKK